jgi:hypothetical protein
MKNNKFVLIMGGLFLISAVIMSIIRSMEGFSTFIIAANVWTASYFIIDEINKSKS